MLAQIGTVAAAGELGSGYFFGGAERTTQPVAVLFENSRSAPQCLQTPLLVGPPGRGSIQWCAQAVVSAGRVEAIREFLSVWGAEHRRIAV
jgi:hypothetical protein